MKRVALLLLSLATIAGCCFTGSGGTASSGSVASDYAALGPLPPKDPVDPKLIERGKMLFFDVRLSGDASMSCATCHQPDKAWTDGVALGTAYPDSKGFRNTKTILNSSYGDYFYWDGRLTKADKDTQVRDMIVETHYLNMDGRLMLERLKQVPEYVELFGATLGGEPSFGRTLKAVAAFQGSLNSVNAPFDAGTMSAEAKRGQRVFEGKAGCVQCHNGPYFSDGQAHATGAGDNPDVFSDPYRHFTIRSFTKFMGVDGFERLGADPGFYIVTKDDADWGKFVTPTLREVSRTAPYMHGGTIETLADVVDFYDAGAGPELKPLGLSDRDKADLVAFLEALSGEDPSIEPPEVPPYQVIADWLSVPN